MNVLVVHDRREVADEIVSVCNEGVFPDLVINLAHDGTSARRCLLSEQYDLLIIDLTLPHIAGRDEPSYSTVDGLLGELFLLDDMRPPGDIIGITREGGALSAISTSIGSHVMTILEEDGGGRWKQHLRDKLRYLVRAGQARLASISSRFQVDVLIMTALDIELAPYREIFEFSPSTAFPGAFSFGFTTDVGAIQRGIAFAVGRSGEARAASATQSLLSIFRPRVVLMTGICGGVEGKTNLGDLVLAESAIDWDYGRWEDAPVTPSEVQMKSPIFRSRPDPVSIFDTPIHRALREFLASNALEDPTFLSNIRRMTEGKIAELRYHLAPMASGSAVIASESVLRNVRDLNDSVRGVDMECFGVYLAATRTHNVRPQVLCIKAVSDFCNGMKNDEFHAACCRATALVGHLFLKTLRFS